MKVQCGDRISDICFESCLEIKWLHLGMCVFASSHLTLWFPAEAVLSQHLAAQPCVCPSPAHLSTQLSFSQG